MSGTVTNIGSIPTKRLSNRLAVWLCPFAGSTATTIILTLKNIPFIDSWWDSWWWCFFGVCVWFVRDTVIGYVIALPLLFLARCGGVKRIGIFMLIAVIAALPMAYVLANPLIYEWTPTEEEFNHGPYWLLAGIYAFVSSATGLLFALGSKQSELPASVVN